MIINKLSRCNHLHGSSFWDNHKASVGAVAASTAPFQAKKPEPSSKSSYDTVLNMQCAGVKKNAQQPRLWSICIYFHGLTCGNAKASVQLPPWEQLWCSCVFCVLHDRAFVGSVGELGQIKNAAEQRGWDRREWQVRGGENTRHVPPRHINNSLCVFFFAAGRQTGEKKELCVRRVTFRRLVEVCFVLLRWEASPD